MGQYELRDLLESCGYNDRFREASFPFQYYRFAKFYKEIFMRPVTTPAQVQHQAQTTSSSPSSSCSTSWERAMSSLWQVAAAFSLPPVDENADGPDLGLPDERDDDPDFGPPDDSPELTQSEAETNVFQPEVNVSQDTSSPGHKPYADAGAGDVPAPPLGSRPDGPAEIIPPPPVERPRRRWLFGREQTLDGQDEEYRGEHQELLHLQDLLRDATKRLEAIDKRISTSTGNELTHFQEKRAELEIFVQDLTDEIEKVRCFKLELWTINGHRHPRGWVP